MQPKEKWSSRRQSLRRYLDKLQYQRRCRHKTRSYDPNSVTITSYFAITWSRYTEGARSGRASITNDDVGMASE
jgi:hypothetical protein